MLLSSLFLSANTVLIFSLLEYMIELVLVPNLKEQWWIITAGNAFTHMIRTDRDEHHGLIMLCNPLSTIGFALVVWRFFSLRIPYEEYYLRRFFGAEYNQYATRVPSGVPFVQ
ncbi:hypothetical protein UlMin_029190 [Ulmus minor]